MLLLARLERNLDKASGAEISATASFARAAAAISIQLYGAAEPANQPARFIFPRC